MTQELDKLYSQIRQAATERELIVVGNMPRVFELPGMEWEDNWISFLDCANQAQVNLLYLKEWRYAPEEIIEEVIRDEIGPLYGFDNNKSADADVDGGETQTYLRARFREVIAPWNVHSGEVLEISSVWIRDGVVHHWRREADWEHHHRETLELAIAEAKQAGQENHRLRTEAEAHELSKRALHMAQHPRFTEATNQDKRTFMANQLFPGIDQWTARHIANQATLIYWWDMEPTERAEVAQRVVALRAQGRSFSSIAAELKISEAKVKRIFGDSP